MALYLKVEMKMKEKWKDYDSYICYSPICAVCNSASCTSHLPVSQCQKCTRSYVLGHIFRDFRHIYI